jgi:NAD(P)-dependent dehydrogenase (short-subunit alcohol dehydrogenase family)
MALSLDVDRTETAPAAIAAAVARFGRIDVLINNAGYGIVGAVEETPEAEWRAVMQTNFLGAMAVTRAALPILRGQRSGAVVNISSLGGQLSYPGFGAYSAAKFALEGASEALALEVAPLGIKVLIVEPGAFRTDFAGAALRHMPAIAAYAETVGPIRDFAHGMNNTQAGDPRRAAEAIERALAAETTPLRLQLGADAVAAVRAHAEKLLADLATWEAVGLATAFPAG